MSKTPFPFMVFSESLPEAQRLHDPNTSTEEKERIRWKLEDTLDLVKSVADRNTQSGRHKDNYKKREQVLKELRRDKRGKPLRGEPGRLASLHKISRRTVEKWIIQVSKAPKGPVVVGDDWQTVYYGQMLRHQNSLAARKKRKS